MSVYSIVFSLYFVFFFNDTATTEIYTLSLHDALPDLPHRPESPRHFSPQEREKGRGRTRRPHLLRRRHLRAWQTPLRRPDRKSTRLNSSHANISYAVFCLKKKKTYFTTIHPIHAACTY